MLEAKQARLEEQAYLHREYNLEQLQHWTGGKLRLHETGRLTDEEGKVKDSMILNKPVC